MEAVVKCPVCNSDANYNVLGKQKNAKAPDYKCTNPNCKMQYNRNTKVWEPSEYRTGWWASQGGTTPQQGFSPQVIAQVAKKPDTNWDKISWGKCKYGFMIELMKQGKDIFVAELEAEKWADAAMRKAGKPEITQTHGYPQVNQNPFDDPTPTINVDDIPM